MLLHVSVLIKPSFCTVHRYTHKQDWINMRPQDRTILITQYINRHQYSNFSEAHTARSLMMVQSNPKHVGAFVVYFNVNFSVLKQIYRELVGVIKDWITSKCTVQV